MNEINLDTIQNQAFPDITFKSESFGGVFNRIYPYIFGAAAIALLIYLLLGGYQMMFSKGDPKAAASAQAKITSAVIGFLIVFFAFLLIQLFGRLLGLQGTTFSTMFGGQ